MKTIAIVLKWMLCVIAAIGLACAAVCVNMSDRAVIGVFFFGGILVALVLGLFDISEPIGRHMSLKQGARSMHRAA